MFSFTERENRKGCHRKFEFSFEGKFKMICSMSFNLITSERISRKYFDSSLEMCKSNYLLELKSARQHQQIDRSSELKENNVVLIKDNTTWLIWKMDAIIQTYSRPDDRTRACTIKLPNGAVIRRPVQLLSPLEFSTISFPDVQSPAKVVAKWEETTRRH